MKQILTTQTFNKQLAIPTFRNLSYKFNINLMQFT